MTGHNVLPQPETAITTPLVEALHFRTGFHYIMVREMEMQIPIPSLEGKECFYLFLISSHYNQIFACDVALISVNLNEVSFCRWIP